MKLRLERLAGDTYVVPSVTNTGVYVRDGRAILIDSGGDDDAGRQLLRLLAEREWSLELIVCTHANADHIGANAFLQKRTGCRIAATAGEAGFVERPLLEPSLLYGGYPMRALRGKFLMAQASSVTDVISSSGPILDTGLDALPLPGHFIDMIGVRTPDNVLFLADSLFSEAIIAKYGLFFLFEVAAHLETLERLDALEATDFVPSHAAPAADIRGLVGDNRRAVLSSIRLVEECCAEPAGFDDVLARVCVARGIALDAGQYVLVGSTVRSMLTYLVERDRVAMIFGGGRLRWAATARDETPTAC